MYPPVCSLLRLQIRNQMTNVSIPYYRPFYITLSSCLTLLFREDRKKHFLFFLSYIVLGDILRRIKVFFFQGILLTLTGFIMRMITMFFNVYISNKIGAEAVRGLSAYYVCLFVCHYSC